MSRAYVMKNFSQQMKKMRPPAEAQLMTFFGATDFNREFRKEFDATAPTDVLMNISADYNMPPSMDLPIEISLPPELLAVDALSIFDLESNPAVLEKQNKEYPALTYEPAKEKAQETLSPAEELKSLLCTLHEVGIPVAEVNELPSGGVRITVDDILKQAKKQTPVLVMAGGGYE